MLQYKLSLVSFYERCAAVCVRSAVGALRQVVILHLAFGGQHSPPHRHYLSDLNTTVGFTF